MTTRSYSEMLRRRSFEDRFNYLKLGGQVGRETFGYDRYLNQKFYTSKEWKRTRDLIIARDQGCDLAVPGYEIYDKILIHHMNPITEDDIRHGNDDIFDERYLISVSLETHNAIHYGRSEVPRQSLKERTPGDTKSW